MLLPNGSFSQIIASETSESEEEYTPPLGEGKTSKKKEKQQSDLNKKKGYYYLKCMGSATIVLLVGCTMTKKSRDNTVTEAPSFSTFNQIEASHDNSLDENKARDVSFYNNFGNQGLVEKSRGSSLAPNVIHVCSSRYCAFFPEESKSKQH